MTLSTEKIKINILANFVGKGWTALMLFIFVPFYIKFMGIEAYGLVGFFTTLQTILSLLDLGLSTTLNREMARLSLQKDKAGEARDLVRTLEIIYWLTAALIAVIVFLLTSSIATFWISSQNLSTRSVQQAVLMMGISIGFQFPFALYSGGMLGLQRHIALNSLIVVTATLRGLGTYLVLWLVSPTLYAFFSWQIFVTAIQTILSAIFLWRTLPKASVVPRFKKYLLLGVWRFAAGMAGIGILATLLTQIDKIILSKLLTLEMFGYYNIASVVASGLYLIAFPVFTAVFPRFSQLVSQGDEEDLKHLYHQSCQFVSVLLLPAATVIALFSPEILMVWTRDALIIEKAHLIVSLLIIGTALNGLMNVPYALQLAYGWTRLALYQNIVAAILLVPLIFWSTSRYGAAGAACVWILLNSIYILIGIQIMHTRLIGSEKKRWYYQDVGLPLLGALCVGLVGRLLFPRGTSILITLVWLGVISMLALIIAAWMTPLIRSQVSRFVFITR